MSFNASHRSPLGWPIAIAGVLGVCAMTLPFAPAKAQVPYFGVDFGNGFGIGVGAPPSAYGYAPASPIYPFYGAPAYYWWPPYYYR